MNPRHGIEPDDRLAWRLHARGAPDPIIALALGEPVSKIAERIARYTASTMHTPPN
ncbi:hypothetical protein [Tsukamurella ocularis]|uniref:hypothetical protein n=1 Tax=Tsukamurella ocularis TaxID=1970234 RepID=UPI002169818F|nr:hypothetical protein [Tsukamurella ocularis]MCS3853265.1 hypothetical protein [Tsukamurella ocularis]